jgi:hypothetical protein
LSIALSLCRLKKLLTMEKQPSIGLYSGEYGTFMILVI